MAEPVYVQAGANVEATDTFATWINTTNALVYDMGTKVLTTTPFAQPNTSVGGYVTGNSQIEGIFTANTLTATTALRGGTVSTPGNLNVTSNVIFSDSNLISVSANTDNFNINANNVTITSAITANTAKSINISAANTSINSGAFFVKTDTTFTGSRVDVDSPVLDVTSNTVITSSTLNANVDLITLGFNSSDTLNVNSVADFNAAVNVDGVFTSTANALFTGAQAQFDNNVIIGSSVADSLVVNAYLTSDLLPSANTVDLGSVSKQYGNVHSMYVYAGADVEAIGELQLKGTAAKTIRVTGSNGSYQNLNIIFSNNSVSNTAIVANTSGLFGGVNQLYSLGSSSVNWKDLYVQNSFVTANEVITGDLAVNGGDITTTATTFNLLETGATTLNAFGAATAIDIGANSGTITINNPTLVGSQTTQNVYNTVATTVNAFGAATTLNVGAATGTATFNNATLAFNGGAVSTNKTTFTLLNTTATTVNAFGAATAISLGAATGTTTVNNNLTVTGDVAVNGGDITTSATTFNLVNGTATTLNIGGAATTLNLGNATGVQTITVGGSTTANSTYNFATGATASGMTKTVNIATGANTGSTTNVNIGGGNGGTVTINSGTLVGAATTQNVFNTTATTVNAFGAATSINLGANTGTLTVVSNTVVGAATTQNVFDTVATTVNAFGAATAVNLGQANAVVTLGKTNGNTSVSIAGNGIAGTATLTSNVTTGTMAIAPSITTGTIDLGSANAGTARVRFTTESDTTSTGALVVSGGAAIAKTLRVGNNAIVSGDLTVLGAVDFQGDVTVNLAEANTAVLKVTSQAQFDGTIASSLIPAANTYNIGSTGSRWNNAFVNTLTATGDVSANNVSASSSLITGAFTVKSGNKDAIILDANVNGSTDRTVTLRTPALGLSANAVVTFADGNTTLQAGTMAITGGTLAQFASTTSSQLAGVISDETGTGSLVFANSPTLVSPTLGAATATSINKLAITAPATSATLTIANGKTATINNTLTLGGTDGSTVAFGAGGTVVYTSNKLSALSATTSAELAGVITDETGTGALVFGTAPTFTTSINSGATFSAFASATALTIGSTGTAASTTNLSTGATTSGATKTVNIGTGGAAGSTTNINFGSSSGTGTATFNNDVTITGNLIVNGSSTTVNSTTITVDDKNIELGSIAGANNITADGGGITLKGTTDKTFNWINATGAWTSSEDLDLASGKVYEINGATVLSATALGTGVTGSSLTSVGTIGTGTWQGTTVAAAYGGTGHSSYTVGDLLFASGTTTLSKLADVATGNALISGGVGVAPSWGKIGLTTHVSGILAGSNGGTGIDNGARTITVGGNLSTANTFTTSGNFGLTLTTTGTTNVTLPTSGTLAVVGSGLNQFASTTSAQLAGVISDETGSGSLVFGTSPTFTTSINSGATFSAFAAATSLTLGYSSTAASTTNLSTGAVASGTTKTLNLGTGGAAGSITNVNIGATGGNTVINSASTIIPNNLIVGTSLSGDVGPILTIGGIDNAGSGYMNGTHTNQLLSGGTGLYALGTIVVTGGAVTGITLTWGGHRYTDNDVLTVPSLSTTVATTGASGDGSTATITFADYGTAPFEIGSNITVAGVTPTGYNGTYVVTASTNTSVSYASTTTGAQTVAGTVKMATALTNSTTTVTSVQEADVYVSNSLGARVRLESNDTSVTAGQEYGAIVFSGRDASTQSSGDLGLIRGVAAGTSGGSEIQLWTAQNALAPKLGAVVTSTGNLRMYNSAGTFYSELSNAPTANRTLTIPDVAGTVSVIQAAASAGYFDTSTTTPTATNRLNFGGNLYPTGLNLVGTADTVTAATHYFVETGTDGFLRPKTLANVQSEIVTANTVGNFAPTKTGTGASGTWSIDITGNAATATNATTVTNGVYTTGDQTIAGIKTFSNALTVQNGANTFTDFFQGRTGTLAAGNPMLFLKKTSNTAFTIGGYNGTATEGTLDLNFTAINTDASIRTSSTIGMRGSAPTMYFRDTDGNSAMLRTDGNVFFILRGENDTETWTQVNGQWPMYIDLTTNQAVFGGNVYAVGNVTAYSDARLKSDVRTIDNALDKVTALRGVYYTKDGKAGLGVIAQETEAVLPEVVVENNNDGYKSVAYGNIVGVLIEAIKELKAEIEELKKGK